MIGMAPDRAELELPLFFSSFFFLFFPFLKEKVNHWSYAGDTCEGGLFKFDRRQDDIEGVHASGMKGKSIARAGLSLSPGYDMFYHQHLKAMLSHGLL